MCIFPFQSNNVIFSTLTKNICKKIKVEEKVENIYFLQARMLFLEKKILITFLL